MAQNFVNKSKHFNNFYFIEAALSNLLPFLFVAYLADLF